MPRSDQELRSGLSTMLDGWEKSADASDAAILAGIKRLISMQQGDNDSPSDAKVMSALRSALAAQEADIQEEA